jgi:hypothetical protein
MLTGRSKFRRKENLLPKNRDCDKNTPVGGPLLGELAQRQTSQALRHSWQPAVVESYEESTS